MVGGHRTPITPAQIAQIKELAGTGLSRAAIAREMGISPSTVGKFSPEGSFDRQGTAQASAAKQIDNRARRAALVDRMMAQAERTLSRLEADTYTYRVKVADSTFVVTDEQPNSEDERNHLTGLAAVMSTVARLEAIDTDTGAAAAKSMLTALGEALGVTSPDS